MRGGNWKRCGLWVGCVGAWDVGSVTSLGWGSGPWKTFDGGYASGDCMCYLQTSTTFVVSLNIKVC